MEKVENKVEYEGVIRRINVENVIVDIVYSKCAPNLSDTLERYISNI